MSEFCFSWLGWVEYGLNETPNGSDGDKGVVLTPEQEKSRRARNVAIGLAVAGFIALFYVVTIVKLGGAAAQPPGSVDFMAGWSGQGAEFKPAKNRRRRGHRGIDGDAGAVFRIRSTLPGVLRGDRIRRDDARRQAGGGQAR